jgi:hypothetical protein
MVKLQWQVNCIPCGVGCELSRPESRAKTTIVKQVLGYFVRNPQAADNLEGVARWRLLEVQIQNSLVQTEAAVEWLVAQGFLLEFGSRGSGRLFRLNPARRDDAISFVEKRENPARKKR